MPISNRAILTILACGLAMLAAGCVTRATPYQPLHSSSAISGGYYETRIDQEHFRVSFAGNHLTSRERVESYLLYRAAELTLLNGFDYFEIEDREVEHQIERQVRRDPLYNPWYSPYHQYWRPYWRYYRQDHGWYHWYPYFGDPFWATRYDMRTIERFEASADIRMCCGVAPKDNQRVFDAREVSERIGPEIERP